MFTSEFSKIICGNKGIPAIPAIKNNLNVVIRIFVKHSDIHIFYEPYSVIYLGTPIFQHTTKEVLILCKLQNFPDHFPFPKYNISRGNHETHSIYHTFLPA